MKLYIPYAKDENEAKSIYQSFISCVEDQTGGIVKKRLIKSIKYKYQDNDFFAEVGQKDSRTGIDVIAILESDNFIICNPRTCVYKGEIISIDKKDVYGVEEF